MNLPKLTKCIILIWLPLANLVLLRKNQLDGRNRRERNLLLFLHRDDKKNFRENVENKMDEKFAMNLSTKPNFLELLTGDKKISKNFHVKNSAELNFERKFYVFTKSEVERKSAHDLAHSLMKHLSALMFDDNNNNRNNNSYNNINSNNSNKYNNKSNNKIYNKTRDRSLMMPTTIREKRRNNRKLLDININSDDHKREVEGDILETNMPESTTPLEDYDELEEIKENNETNELGSYLGAPCELTCSEKLIHVFCDLRKRVCECEDKYPVQIGIGTGCEKPNQIGDQCFYAETCSFFDSNAVCTQINHNAVCQCKPGYHAVALRRGVKRMFCSEDVIVVSADLPTLLGVATGIALLTGLLCFVLRLFSGNRYPATRHYGNANLAPPLLYSSDNQWINGIPLTVQGRSSSRSSCQRSTMSLPQHSRSKGVLVPASRAGAARAAAILLIPCHLQASRHSDTEVVHDSNNDDVDVQEIEVDQSSRIGSRRHSLTSVHSTTSSQKSISYSARRFEQENQQREQRAAMRAAREEAARMATLPTPSPSSTDDILLINTSTNNEEDFLCSSVTDSAIKSEPPAFLYKKGNSETLSSKTTSDAKN